MDPFSLTVGVFGILQAVTACLKAAKKHVGPSAMSSAEAETMMRALYEFHGAMGSFKTHLELHDDDDDRMTSLEYLRPVITRSHKSLQIVKDYISSGRTEKVFRGVKFDKELKTSLKSLDDASKLFSMAVLATQQAIILGVNTYVQEISDDIKDVQAVQINSQQDNLFHDVRAWLAAQTDNDTNKQIHEWNLSTRHDGSGKWLLSHATFQDWLTTKDKGTQVKLWLRGSPGAGKSSLCSTAIEHVSNKMQGICLYYFYRFDDQSEVDSRGDGTVRRRVKAAALLVDQLFRYFWTQDRRIATPVSDYIRTVEKTMTSLTEVTRLILRHGHRYAQGVGTAPNTELVSLYLFLDGLDENKDPLATNEILKLFDGVEEELPVIQKSWISSRETHTLKQGLQQWPVINVDKHAETDVENFLTYAVPKFDNNAEVEGKPLYEWVLQELQARAKGNFLYARLMVERLRRALSIDDVMTFIKSTVPNDFADIYKRIFCQYQEDQHKYVSLLFSLVAFARRPLHLNELREAITLALSDPTKGLDPRKAPMSLQRLFAPLIETQSDPNEPDNPLCRLCHSTVREFLTTNPEVLRVSASSQISFTYGISASRVGDLFLRYLSQERYSTLLEMPSGDCHEPPALLYDDSQQHALLPYSAKYWDRHLEDLEPTPERLQGLRDFVRSSNFQTLIQVQSLFVTAQFSQFKMKTLGKPSKRIPMHRRVFPSWFGRDSDTTNLEYREECIKIRRDYLHFVNEWGYLLERSTSLTHRSGECLDRQFLGQVDRCLTGLLGPEHFMNRMKEKYQSFMLTREPFEYTKFKQFVIADAVSASASQFIIMSSPSQDSTEVSLDTWDLKLPGLPQLVSPSAISATNIDFKSDAARSLAFSYAVANFVFGRRGCDTRVILDQQTAHPNIEPLSTDFDMRDGIVVIASRNVHKKTREEKPPKKDSAVREVIDPSEDSNFDSSENESDDDSDDGYSSSSTDENSAYETCSEGSTELESDESESEMSEDDIEVDDQSVESSEEEDEGESDLELTDDEADAKQQESQRDILVFNYQKPGESKLELGDDLLERKDEDRPTYPGMPNRFRDPNDRITASIAVYNVNSGQAVRMFHYEQESPAMLYHSPPVLHPQEALLVWPLGGGEVLFADYEEKTYFIRATMPTTSDTRHICVKAKFSPCRSYLHIASVEGRLLSTKPSNATSSDGGDAKKPEIVLSLFLTTHRLSSRKTTRSPPRLVHKVKLTLGQFTGLSLAKLPFTFTWAPEHLHFTVSGVRLNVFRIGLFGPLASSSTAVVTTPKLSVMLPLSASSRQVYYLPPAAGGGSGAAEGLGVVLIGSYGASCQPVQLQHRSARAESWGMGNVLGKELLSHACPAVGLFVDEERDLGGWTALDMEGGEEEGLGLMATVDGGERFRDGKLIRKIEAFNWREDVDLEGICHWCNRQVTYKAG